MEHIFEMYEQSIADRQRLNGTAVRETLLVRAAEMIEHAKRCFAVNESKGLWHALGMAEGFLQALDMPVCKHEGVNL